VKLDNRGITHTAVLHTLEQPLRAKQRTTQKEKAGCAAAAAAGLPVRNPSCLHLTDCCACQLEDMLRQPHTLQLLADAAAQSSAAALLLFTLCIKEQAVPASTHNKAMQHIQPD
jgi:hypothetical protein